MNDNTLAALAALDQTVPSTTSRTRDQIVFDVGVAYGQFSKGVRETPAFSGIPFLVKNLRLQTELARLAGIGWSDLTTSPAFIEKCELAEYYPLSFIADLAGWFGDFLVSSDEHLLARSLGRTLGYLVHIAGDQTSTLIENYVE